ncbi:MAG TPA: hypothetical protein PLJ78_13890 [Anaerolineae bacterium]|nr:hypothetical protein [Anaerolineae bacterium]HQK15022.1 hypothetical protein [Anaerolineae bacterium]
MHLLTLSLTFTLSLAALVLLAWGVVAATGGGGSGVIAAARRAQSRGGESVLS